MAKSPKTECLNSLNYHDENTGNPADDTEAHYFNIDIEKLCDGLSDMSPPLNAGTPVVPKPAVAKNAAPHHRIK
jgi:hypothetical protein